MTVPTLTGLAHSVTFSESAVNGAARIIDSDVVFKGGTGGTLVVSGLLPEDIVSINDQGTGPGELSLSGADLIFDGLTFGTFAGGDGKDLVVTLNGLASPTAIDAVIENLAYANLSDVPTASRTLSIAVTDGGGAALAPAVFEVRTDVADPLKDVGVGAESSPFFTDFDGDGDLDLLVGGQDGSISYFRNVGSSSAPAFLQQTGDANPFDGVSTGAGSSAKPGLADLDHDGDLDLAVGMESGSVPYFENTGTQELPAFAGGTEVLSVGSYAAPTAVDIDHDGDLDAVVGNAVGKLAFFRNIGTATEPQLSRAIGAESPFAGIDVGDRAAPSFVDLDGDGDFDLAVGAADGTVKFFENTGSASAPIFTERTGSANPFDGIDVGSFAAPTFADLDGDADPDAIIGGDSGNLAYFENTATLRIVVNVTPENDAPVADGRLVQTTEDSVVTALLAASDPDGTIVKFVVDSGVSKGLLAVGTDGSFSFDPRAQFDSLDTGDVATATFTFHAIDNQGAATQVQSVDVVVLGVNDAPVITSAGGAANAKVTVVENIKAVTVVTASDPDDTPSFAIVGGADAGLFTINAATGALAFKAPADFDAPADADGDNTYLLTVKAGDGTASDTQTIAVVVTNQAGKEITGTARADTLTGTSEEDNIDGGKGKDKLFGDDGDDRLTGGKDNDKLTGGLGEDSFVFNQKLKSNIDKVKDFQSGLDSFALDDKVFRKLSPGPLSVEEFVTGNKAKDGDDHVIYNQKNGQLLYDRDGDGGHDAIAFAKIGKGLDLDTADFLVI